MYAVIRTGGKQYKVAPEDVIEIEKIEGEDGASVTFAEVLLVGDGDNVTVGAPVVEGASVAAQVVEQTRGPKIIVFKKKRRQNYRRRHGHRQDITVVRITDILTAGQAKAARTRKAKPAAEAAPEGAAQGVGA